MNPSLRAQTKSHIKKHGFSMIGVFGKGEPSFTYSIGVSIKYGYELIIVGLRPESAGIIITDIFKKLKEGEKLELNVPDSRWANLPCKFALCGEKVHEYVVQADEYFYKKVDVLQMIMPDRHGIFPGEPGFDEAYMGLKQPLL